MRWVDVEVLAKYQLDGKIIPVSVKWDDGRTFEIEQVIDVRPADLLYIAFDESSGVLLRVGSATELGACDFDI